MTLLIWISSLIVVAGTLLYINVIIQCYRYDWSIWQKTWAIAGIVLATIVLLIFIALPKILNW